MADTIYLNEGKFEEGTGGSDVMVANTPGQIAGYGGSDNLNGSSGNDVLTGGKGNDFMFGGKGNDTFLFYGSDLASGVEGKTTTDKIFDFEGAGERGGDSLVFANFGVGSTFEKLDYKLVSSAGTTYKYKLMDTFTGDFQFIFITSKTGAELTTNDYRFQGSKALPA